MVVLISNELREKKLSFERMYNYEELKDITIFLNNNPGLSSFLIKSYKEMFKEYDGKHSDYYDSIQEKLMFLEDLQNGN